MDHEASDAGYDAYWEGAELDGRGDFSGIHTNRDRIRARHTGGRRRIAPGCRTAPAPCD